MKKLDYVMAKINSYHDSTFSKITEKVVSQIKEFYNKRANDIELLPWSKIKGHDFHYEIEHKVEIERKKAILKERVEKLERHAYAPELNTLWFKSGKCRKVYQCNTIDDAIIHVIGNGITIAECKAI